MLTVATNSSRFFFGLFFPLFRFFLFFVKTCHLRSSKVHVLPSYFMPQNNIVWRLGDLQLNSVAPNVFVVVVGIYYLLDITLCRLFAIIVVGVVVFHSFLLPCLLWHLPDRWNDDDDDVLVAKGVINWLLCAYRWQGLSVCLFRFLLSYSLLYFICYFWHFFNSHFAFSTRLYVW